jgi:alpha-D-ribose 1-methylphosphonate 5-triphosphate diphosphatase
VKLVTANPAGATGLADRGEIALDKRADVIRVRATPDMPPLVRSVWRTGERVA